MIYSVSGFCFNKYLHIILAVFGWMQYRTVAGKDEYRTGQMQNRSHHAEQDRWKTKRLEEVTDRRQDICRKNHILGK